MGLAFTTSLRTIDASFCEDAGGRSCQALWTQGDVSMLLRRALWLPVLAVLLVFPLGSAHADVSKEYARDHWNKGSCTAMALEDVLATGDVTGDGRADAVMLWSCTTGVGGAHPRIVTYWIDGNPIKQKSFTTPLPQAHELFVRRGLVIVKGGDYSAPGVPRCCPDIGVKLIYEWNGRKLALVDEVRKPLH